MNLYIKKLNKNSIIIIFALFLVFTGYNNIVRAATGGGTATIAVDGGAQGAGVTVVQSTSHTFTAVLTINVSGMTLGAASPTFTIPTGFTAPNASPVAVAGDVNADVTAPTVAVTMDDDALNIGDTSLVTFTFSETQVEFATADVTVANGSIGAIDTSNPLVQTATYTPTNGITDATNVITVGT